MSDGKWLDVDGRAIRISHLDKVLFPKSAFRKRDVLNYYRLVAPWILPHLQGRPLTLKRFPDGIDEPHFFAKRCPSNRPDWIPVIEREDLRYCGVDSLAALIWVVNLAGLELHVPLSRLPELARPDLLVFDLDPGPGAGLLECAEVAFRLKKRLFDDGFDALIKTSGSKGLQLYVRTDRAFADFDELRDYSRSLAVELESARPGQIVSSQKKELRPGKVLIDWSQNSPHKTTVCVYSLRAVDPPRVSAPVSWDELAQALSERDERGLRISPRQMIERLRARGDLFAPLLERAREKSLVARRFAG
jgi:bifunctional non-homologous end joining protein LigD